MTSFFRKKKDKDDKKEEERIYSMTKEELASEYLEKGVWSWDLSWDILHRPDWKLVAGSDREVGCVHYGNFPDIGKIFKLEGIVDAPAQLLFEELVLRVTDSPKWNESVLEARILQVINDNTDICYNVAADVGGGIIAKRDFVNVRHWKKRAGTIMSAGCNVLHPDMPPRHKIIRGENKPGGWIFQEIPGQPHQCVFMWLMNTDLKGWIPQAIIDSTVPRFLMDYIKGIREHSKIFTNQTR